MHDCRGSVATVTEPELLGGGMDLEHRDGSWIDITPRPVLHLKPGQKVAHAVCVWCGCSLLAESWETVAEAVRQHQQVCPDNRPLIDERKKVAALQEDIDRLRAKRSKKK